MKNSYYNFLRGVALRKLADCWICACLQTDKWVSLCILRDSKWAWLMRSWTKL